MSDHHCWYVTGRTLRLALVYVLFASLSVVNPAFAVEAPSETAQQTVTSSDPVTVLSDAKTIPAPVGSEQDNYTQTVADLSATDAASLTPAAGYLADDVFVLSKTGEVFETVLAVQRKNRTLIPALIALERDGKFFVPLDRLGSQIKFPSTFDKDTLQIRGQYFGGANSYLLDASEKTVESFGKAYPLPEDSFITRIEGDEFDDIYVSAEILNLLWPLDFVINPNFLTLEVQTERRLPFELEAERLKRQQQLEAKRKRELEPLSDKYVFVPNGYKLLGPQSFVFSQSTSWNNDNKLLSNSVSVNGTGDILGTEARYSLGLSKSTGSKLELDRVKTVFRREDSGDGNLLPFGLSGIEVGDINLYAPKLVAGGIGGAGFSFSSGRQQVTSDFDEITITGNAEAGWDVEIYRNNILIDFGSVDEDGEYRFENVPINYGNNEVRVVLYGPEGQIEERTETYNIGRKLLKPGEVTYRAGAVYVGNRFFDVKNTNNPDAKLSKSVRADMGFNEFITTFATYTEDNSFQNRLGKYVSVGADFDAFGGVGRAEAYKQLNAEGGEAVDLSFGKRFFGVNTTFTASIFNKFESVIAGYNDFRKSGQYTARFSKGFETDFGGLNLSASASLDTYEKDSTPSRLNLQSLQGLSTKYGNFSHTLSSDYRDGELENRQGSIVYSKKLAEGLSGSTSLAYTLEPEADFTTASLDLRYRNDNKLTSFLGYTQSLDDTAQRNLNLGASYEFEKFRANFGLDWDNEGGTDIRIGASTSLGPNAETGIYEFSKNIQKSKPGFTARLFYDVDGNGEYNEGDELIPGTSLLVNGKRSTPPSDENGLINAERVGQGFATITIDRTRYVFNPFLIPARKSGFSTILRPGTSPHIEFPLVMSGSIDGTLSDADDYGMTNITLQLIDERGQLAAETKTIASGFYTFELVRPGRYIVQVHPSHRVFVPPKTVTVSSEDLFAYGVDLRVLEQAPTDEAAAVEVERDGRVAHTYHDASVAGGDEKPAQSHAFDYVEAPSDRGVQSVIRAVRVGEHPDKTRLVLDLSGPLSYEVTREKNDDAIYIELPNTITSVTDAEWKSGPHALFSSIEILALPNGGAQIKLNANTKLDVLDNALIPASNGLDDRLYIDFTKAK